MSPQDGRLWADPRGAMAEGGPAPERVGSGAFLTSLRPFLHL